MLSVFLKICSLVLLEVVVAETSFSEVEEAHIKCTMRYFSANTFYDKCHCKNVVQKYQCCVLLMVYFSNFLNLGELAGNPGDYVWGPAGLDAIITQVCEVLLFLIYCDNDSKLTATGFVDYIPVATAYLLVPTVNCCFASVNEPIRRHRAATCF